MSTPADLTVLVDAPALEVADGSPVDSHAAGLAATLDWAHQARQQRGGSAALPIVVVRRGADPDADALLTTHPARPHLIELSRRQPGVDPEGWLLTALRTPLTLALHPGVVPDTDTLEIALAHLRQHRTTAALTGRVTRTDEADEAHPLPGALHSGAVMLRTEAVRAAGGFSRLLPPGGAADLDLACRLLRDGGRPRRDDGLRFIRAAWPEPALPDTRAAADAVRDALIIIDRYFPRPIRRALRRDTLDRAAVFHGDADARRAFAAALLSARRAADWERRRGRSVLHADQLERLLGWDHTRRAVADWSVREQTRRVVLAGWHPNLYVAFRAAQRVGVTITAVADETPVPPGTMYRGVPVLPLRDVIDGRVDGVVVTDQHPATAADTARRVSERFAGPVLSLWKPRRYRVQRVDRAERPAAPFAPRLAA